MPRLLQKLIDNVIRHVAGHNSERYFKASDTRTSTRVSYFSQEQTRCEVKNVGCADEIFPEAFILTVWVGASSAPEGSSSVHGGSDLNLFPDH